ncbi:MAG: zinc-ribbon domain-containing protein [Erysipelotrichaceae bacterium]|nr:zinc-ribbon domain-containing protein [Erysipelotrichaceae bacterium]
MSLSQCPECGSKISQKAKVCPHCGYISFDPLLAISVQEKFEIVPTFKFEVEDWNSNRSENTVVSYENNKVFYEYYGKWDNIKNKLPTLAKAIKEMAKQESELVADISPYLKKMIDSGEYKLVIDKSGKLLATLRGPKGFVKNIRLKQKDLSPDLSNSVNNLVTQMALDQIIKEIKYLGNAISEIHVELQNDRIALAESSKFKLLQARNIQDSRLRELAILNVVNSATDAKCVLMRNFSQNLKYLDEHANTTNRMILPGGKKPINQKALDSMLALKTITDTVQVETVGYAMLGEYDACMESLSQFRNFIFDNKLNERDTLLLLNESLEKKQIEVVDKFSEVALRIANINDLKQIDFYNQDSIVEKENENENI